jgi:hypothetical protein
MAAMAPAFRKDASSEAELLEALAPRIDRSLFDGPQPAGSLVFQPTEERRRSGPGLSAARISSPQQPRSWPSKFAITPWVRAPFWWRAAATWPSC